MAWLALIAAPGMSYSEMLAPFIVAGVGVSMAIPAAQNSVVGSVATEAIGKAAGANSMMRELGGVFGIAIVVAVFAGAGSYASPAAFTDGFGPAIGVAAALALAGAVAGLALPGRREAADGSLAHEPAPGTYEPVSAGSTANSFTSVSASSASGLRLPHHAAAGEAVGDATRDQAAAQRHAELAVLEGVHPAQRRGVPAAVHALQLAHQGLGARPWLAPDRRRRVQRARQVDDAQAAGRAARAPESRGAGCWRPSRAPARPRA